MQSDDSDERLSLIEFYDDDKVTVKPLIDLNRIDAKPVIIPFNKLSKKKINSHNGHKSIMN